MLQLAPSCCGSRPLEHVLGEATSEPTREKEAPPLVGADPALHVLIRSLHRELTRDVGLRFDAIQVSLDKLATATQNQKWMAAGWPTQEHGSVDAQLPQPHPTPLHSGSGPSPMPARLLEAPQEVVSGLLPEAVETQSSRASTTAAVTPMVNGLAHMSSSISADYGGCNRQTRRAATTNRTASNKWEKASGVHDKDFFEQAVLDGWSKHKVIAEKAVDIVNEQSCLSKFEPSRDGRFYQFVDGKGFAFFSMSMIVLNAIIVGWSINFEAELAMLHGIADLQHRSDLFTVKIFFAVQLVLEVSLRMLGLRRDFFTTEDVGWNIFDFILMVSVLVELVTSSDTMANMMFLRVLRVIRMVRLLRVIRMMRWFSELRLMVEMIICSTRMLLWALTLVLIVMYLVALVLTQGATQAIMGTSRVGESDESDIVNDDLQGIEDKYGNIGRTILVLFAAVTGGQDWSDVMSPLWGVGKFYVGIFLAYVTFMVFAVMNIVTAIFIEHAVKSAQHDSDHVLKQELAEEEMFIKEMTGLFESADNDYSGELTVDELEIFLNDKGVRARLKVFGLEVHEAWSFFNLLDFENKGHLTAQEFALGCLRLRGQAKSVDMASIRVENKLENKRIIDTLSRRIERLRQEMHTHFQNAQKTSGVNALPFFSPQHVPVEAPVCITAEL